jgi:predicted transcriptional regulator
MKSYIDILKHRAEECGIRLLKAFKYCDIPTSTYYRTINGDTELRYETAVKVMNSIEKLYAFQQASAHTEELRRAGISPNRSTIRAQFKPRITG